MNTSRRRTDTGLDDVARLASLVCDAPFAVLTLNGFEIDWFTFGTRIDDDARPSQNPFDTYTRECAEIFDIADACLDERFATQTPILGGHPLRFYAGVRLVKEDGAVFGTLAVLDSVPRQMSAKHRSLLNLLARQTAANWCVREELVVAQARLESAPVAIYQTDARGGIFYANREYRRFLGLTPSESLENWANAVLPEDKPRMIDTWAAFCENPQPVAFEWRTVPRDGISRVYIESVVEAAGAPGFIGTITDITERVEATARLEHAETLFQTTFDQAPIGIIYLNEVGLILRSNRAFSALMGFDSGQLATMQMAQLTHGTEATAASADYARLWRGEIDVIDREARLVGLDARTVWARATYVLLRETGGTVNCAVAFLRDISARKQLNVALSQNQRLLDAVIADIPVAIRACDIHGRVFLRNPIAAKFFPAQTQPARVAEDVAEGNEIQIFLPDGKTRVPFDELPLARALRGDVVEGMELVIARSGEAIKTTRSSARRLVGEAGECLGAVAVTQDVTQELKLERELSHARKMESIGQLAAGIAHEINTPTQFIGDNVRFLGESFQDILGVVREVRELCASAAGGCVPVDSIAATVASMDMDFLQEEIPKAIGQSLNGVERIAKIVGAMKEFSHPSVELTPLDLNRAIANTIVVASSEWKYVAEVRTEFDLTLPLVPVIPGSFNQVILNMIVNAAHAIGAAAPEAPGHLGTITIKTRHSDQWVEIDIVDTGCGIPAETLPKIFDLFFTTKPVGTGTGQGLAIAHDVVVVKHGGTIEVDSTVGVGTTFRLRFPKKS